MRLIQADEETVIENNGETGGPERNLGKEFSKRYTWEKDEGGYLTITTTTYITARDQDNEDVEYSDLSNKLVELELWKEDELAESKRIQDRQRAGEDIWLSQELNKWQDEHPQPIRFVWEEQTEIVDHEALEEIDGDVEYESGEGSYLAFDSLAEAEEDAKASIDRLSVDMFNV